jgi:HNH endonuclease
VLDNRQKGRCEFCNRPIGFESIGEETKPESLEVYHIKSLHIGGVHKGYSNKSLLHESCHTRVHKIFGKKKQITKLPFRKKNLTFEALAKRIVVVGSSPVRRKVHAGFQGGI